MIRRPHQLILLVFGMFTLFSGPLQAQEKTGYEIKVKVKGASPEEGDALLAYYYGNKQYIKDTVPISPNGEVIYKGKEPLDGGIYLIVMPGMKYFEAVITDDQHFSMETELEDMVGKMKVKGSDENEAFYTYLQYIEEKQKLMMPIRQEFDSLAEGAAKKEKLRKQLVEIEEEIKAYKVKFIQENKNMFISKVLSASQDPEIPTAIQKKAEKDSSSNAAFYYYRTHYFDNIDFFDARLIRTPVFHNKISTYIKKLTVQHQDSIILAAEYLIAKAQQDPTCELFKYIVIFITNEYAKSKIMCHDKVYLHMAQNYYTAKDPSMHCTVDWVEAEQLEKIEKEVIKLKYNQCNDRAQNLLLEGHKGTKEALYNVNAKYTIVYFWDYDCGHCKKTTPKLAEFYEKNKDNGIKIFAVCTRDDKAKWKAYIEENKIGDWIHVIDPEYTSYFREFYNVFSTPVVYLLDRSKIIRGKRLDVENLEDFIKRYEEMLQLRAD